MKWNKIVYFSDFIKRLEPRLIRNRYDDDFYVGDVILLVKKNNHDGVPVIRHDKLKCRRYKSMEDVPEYTIEDIVKQDKKFIEKLSNGDVVTLSFSKTKFRDILAYMYEDDMLMDWYESQNL